MFLRPFLLLLLPLAACSSRNVATSSEAPPPSDAVEAPKLPADAGSTPGDVVADAAVEDADASGPFDYCTAQATRYATCFPTKPFDYAQCKKGEACLFSILQPDVDVVGYLKCTSASCSGGGSKCLGRLSGHEKDPAFVDFLSQCKTRLTACGDLGPDQFEDACSPFAVLGLRDEILTERATCLTEACSTIATCMSNKLATRCSL